MEAKYGCKTTAHSQKDEEEIEEVGEEQAMAQVSAKCL